MIRIERAAHTYRTRARAVRALDGVDLEANRGEMICVRGPSGSGKSTLLLAAGGMLRPTSGRVEVAGSDPYALGAREAARFRAEHVGFVFQMFHLVPYLDVRRNVLLGAAPAGGAREDVDSLLDRLGLAERATHRPRELSAGERQRVAVARALIKRPSVVLADEPTGNLDPDNSAEVFRHLAAFRDDGGTVLVVTHGADAGGIADRTLELRDGRFAPESGAVHPGLLALGSLAAVVILVLLLLWNAGGDLHDDEPGDVMIWCAAGIRPPVEAAARDYATEVGDDVRLEYAGTKALLGKISLAPAGDLFVAADDSYLALAQEKGLVAEVIPLAHIRPVLAVARGNPKGIRGLDDLVGRDVQVALANPDTAAIGQVVRTGLERSGRWEALRDACKVFKPTVTDVANDVKLGTVDATIVWDATAAQYPELEALPLPSLATIRQTIAIGVLTCARSPRAALRFARFLAASDRGLRHFDRLGYTAARGDIWEARPRVVLFSGAMLRPGIDEAITAFERREGCEVVRVYDGCGNLVSRMRAEAEPDAYVSCDRSFMDMVQDRFEPAVDLTENDMVIAVRKGNPHGVRSLADLAEPGLKLGLAHPQNSALGALTDRMLERAGLRQRVRANKRLDSATGDLLVNQIKTGSLDAVIVYRSNVLSHPPNLERLEVVDLGIPDAVAIQNYAAAKDGTRSRLVQRLFDAITTAEQRRGFESIGFRWRRDG